MIVVKTDMSDEVIKQLSDYFYMDDSFIFITTIDEINGEENINSMLKEYGGKLFKNKIMLTYPVFICTESADVVEYLENAFICNIYIDEFPSLNDMIAAGFLPISSDVIMSFIHAQGLDECDDTYKIFSIFESLGYVRNMGGKIFIPTEKLIESIIDIQPQLSAAYTILINNKDVYLSDSKNIDTLTTSLLESLKLIDICVHLSVKTN